VSPRLCPECGQRLHRHNLADDPVRVRARAERILAGLPKEPVMVTLKRREVLARDAWNWTAPADDHAARLLAGVTKEPTT
jgi:hypothetical protein